MAGKTGTSQAFDMASNRIFLNGWEGKTHSLFIAFAPVGAPRYAAACVVEHGGGGAETAAPIVHDVMTEISAARSGQQSPPSSPATSLTRLRQ